VTYLHVYRNSVSCEARSAPVLCTVSLLQNNEHQSPRTNISPFSLQAFNIFVVCFFVFLPSLIKTHNFSNPVLLLQTVKSSWYTFKLCHKYCVSVFFLSFLYFLSLLFTSSSYLSGMCSLKRQNRFQVSPRYLFGGFRDVFPVGEASETISWPLFPTTDEVKNERREYSTSFYAFMTSRNQTHCTVFRRSRNITKSDYQLRHVCPSICPSILPHGTTRLPIDGFSWNSVLEDFRKSVEKIQVSLKWTKIKGTWRPLYIVE